MGSGRTRSTRAPVRGSSVPSSARATTHSLSTLHRGARSLSLWTRRHVRRFRTSTLCSIASGPDHSRSCSQSRVLCPISSPLAIRLSPCACRRIPSQGDSSSLLGSRWLRRPRICRAAPRPRPPYTRSLT
eukprot:Amastigsp_a174555_19.p3 type:complete len:130 gc:universal Amastigsp_a174555_19:289-678(+)